MSLVADDGGGGGGAIWSVLLVTAGAVSGGVPRASAALQVLAASIVAHNRRAFGRGRRPGRKTVINPPWRQCLSGHVSIIGPKIREITVVNGNVLNLAVKIDFSWRKDRQS